MKPVIPAQNIKRVIAYIDGFNLYHAIDELNKPHLKWLDLWALSKSILRDREQLERVYYFSAYANWKPASVQRHRIYVTALKHQLVTCEMAISKKRPVLVILAEHNGKVTKKKKPMCIWALAS